MKKTERTKKQLRIHNMAFKLTETEYRTVRRYLDKYRIKNKSRWCRETLLFHILRTLEEDYPTLFSENEMRR
ncbi:MAG: hypothetical protein LBS05_08005 [Tannerellaceae bacterium]|jgi:hypothetical protein|nr:hypothetical protein [Tannerellaceae bacterium]